MEVLAKGRTAILSPSIGWTAGKRVFSHMKALGLPSTHLCILPAHLFVLFLFTLLDQEEAYCD
jgi:hypothetical protein